MTLYEFMRIARARRLSCGSHFIVYDNGVIEEFVIFANAYNGFRYKYKPPREVNKEKYVEKYRSKVIEAHEKDSTLFCCYGSPPPKFIDSKEDVSVELGDISKCLDPTYGKPFIS